MTLAKLKAKNQLTIPSEVVKKLHLRKNELFAVEVEKNFIKLTPVEVEPRYTPEELNAIDQIVNQEKSKAKKLKPRKKEVKKYLRNFK